MYLIYTPEEVPEREEADMIVLEADTVQVEEVETDTVEDIQDTVEDGTIEVEEGSAAVVAVDIVVGSVKDLEVASRVSQIVEAVVVRTGLEAVDSKEIEVSAKTVTLASC